MMTRQDLQVEIAAAHVEAAQARVSFTQDMATTATALLQTNATSQQDAKQRQCDYWVAKAELREANARLELAKLGDGS